MNLWNKLRIFKLMIQLIRNPNRTELIFKGIRIVSQNPAMPALKKVEEKILGHEEFRKMYEAGYMPEMPVMEILSLLPENSFGRALHQHMQKNNLDFSIFPRSDSQRPIEYISNRIYQDHDLWHVILGKGIDIEDELAIQAFGVAQLHSPIGTLLLAGGLIHLLSKDPIRAVQALFTINDAFQLGRRAKFLLGIKIHNLLPRPLDEVRALCGVQVESKQATFYDKAVVSQSIA